MSEPGKILIIKLSALGDVVMALPAMLALRRRYPQAQIDWLVEAPSAGIIKKHPALNRVIVSPRHQMKHLFQGAHFIKAERLLRSARRELRQTNYDIVLDLQGLAKSALKVWQAKGSRKVGFDRSREYSHHFLNEKMPAYDLERHAALRYLDAAVYLGAEMPAGLQDLDQDRSANFSLPFPPYYEPRAEDEAAADLILNQVDQTFIVLNPGAKWLSKRWPVAHWAALAKVLAAEGRSLVITGGREDLPAGEVIAQAAPSALNLCGQTSFPVLAAVLKKAQAMVTADTGAMHLMAAVGGGGLALFGPTRPWRTGPFGGHFKILRPPLSCLACLNRKCAKDCLSSLAPDQVLSELRYFIDPV